MERKREGARVRESSGLLLVGVKDLEACSEYVISAGDGGPSCACTRDCLGAGTKAS